MGRYRVVFTKKATNDLLKLRAAKLGKKAKELVMVLEENPYKNPPSYEKLVGDLSGTYSRRINIKHRLVYLVNDEEKIVKVLRMWTHYE